MHNIRRLTVAFMLAAFAAVAALGAVAWADTGDHPNRGMHAIGTIKSIDGTATPHTFTIQPLMERAGSPERTFSVDDKTKYFIYDNLDAKFTDLKTGMRVEVDAHKASDSDTWLADMVTVVPPVPAAMGRVTAVYPTTTTFVIRSEEHGAAVTTDNSTIFRVPQSSNTPPTFADIKVGDWVSVWAKPKPAAEDNDHPAPSAINPAYVVQVVRRAPPPPPPPTTRLFNEDGKIAGAVDTTNETFTLSYDDGAKTAIVHYHGAVILPKDAKLAENLRVRVVGTYNPSSASPQMQVNARIIVVEHEHD
ncbi:MAG: DUF5666 domain-containing protein [Anaerolineae bacterium]